MQVFKVNEMNGVNQSIHVWAPSFSEFGGGITAYSAALVQALHNMNFGIDLFGKQDTSGRWLGLRLNGSARWPQKIRTIVFSVMLILGALRRRPKLILSTHLNFGPIAHFIRSWFGIPYVLVAHGIDVTSKLSPARLKALQSADFVWAVSGWTRQRLIDINVSPDRIHVIPNTVSGQNFVIAPQDDGLRTRYGLRPTDKVVLTVARLDGGEGYKGYDRVLQALPRVMDCVDNVYYLIVGKGSDAARIRDLAAQLGVADRLILCGFVSDGELPAHYRLANVFAMPSTGEGFGIVFLEAMACGVPVLAGNHDGSVDALAQGELGLLVDPTNVQAIADGLISLLRHEGSDFWFVPHEYRAACLSRFGQLPFQEHIAQGLAKLL
jgi:glycosyltransferase involved in cell wall biosynthesis